MSLKEEEFLDYLETKEKLSELEKDKIWEIMFGLSIGELNGK